MVNPPARRRLCVQLLWLFLLFVGLSPAPARADTVPPTAETTGAPAKPNRTDRQIKAVSGLAALAGIIIAGLSLVALVLVWGRRLRRQLRRAPADTTAGADFWFLKPPKPKGSETDLQTSHLPSHEPPESES